MVPSEDANASEFSSTQWLRCLGEEHCLTEDGQAVAQVFQSYAILFLQWLSRDSRFVTGSFVDLFRPFKCVGIGA